MASVREVQYRFWSSFGVPAFEENSVPTGDDFPGFPYITFPIVSGGFDSDYPVFASIWTRSPSWLPAIEIADRIEGAIKNGGKCLPHNDGMLWVSPREPFSRCTGDPNDSEVKRMLIDVTLHFN